MDDGYQSGFEKGSTHGKDGAGHDPKPPILTALMRQGSYCTQFVVGYNEGYRKASARKADEAEGED